MYGEIKLQSIIKTMLFDAPHQILQNHNRSCTGWISGAKENLNSLSSRGNSLM